MQRGLQAQGTVLLLFFLLALGPQGQGAPPTKEAKAAWIEEGKWDEIVAIRQAFIEAGGDSPEVNTPFRTEGSGRRLALGGDIVDTAYAIVILVDFSDNPYTGGAVSAEPDQIDSTLFSDNYYNPAGSMTDFYIENSYGNFVVKGDIYGWYEAPNSYAWYVGTDNGLSRSHILVSEAVQAVAPDVPSWTKYDHNSDGYCDGLIIIHAGPGAEEGYGEAIWSHKSNISPIIYDGVLVSAYTMNAEEFGGDISPIGVFCHEYGHFLGLPDLYDVSGTPGSNGLGDWSLMATGTYNGSARTPAHLDAWCKNQAGFLTWIGVDQNLHQVTIPNVEDNPVSYRLQNDLSGSSEYWIVENRQLVGFDVGLPAAGLCIYHVDLQSPSPNNQNPGWYRVAMEQADGDNALAFGGSYGDGGDPWPGYSNARDFHDLTTPNTRTNDSGFVNNGATTRIGLWSISDNGMIMTADLDEDWSRPWPVLADHDSILLVDPPPGGDGDGLLEPGETVLLYCTLANLMRTGYNTTVSLTFDNPAVTVTVPSVLLTSTFDNAEHSNLSPLEFTLASSFAPVIDSFQLTLTSDSVAGLPGSEWYTTVFDLETTLGPPPILIVDDDRGEDYEQIYQDLLYHKRIPFDTWPKSSSGPPSGAYLQQFHMVFWHTGDSAENIFSADDVAAMKNYLEARGNLLLSSISGGYALHVLDSVFMHDYLGASWSGSMLWPFFEGVGGNPVGDGTKYRYLPTPPMFTHGDLMEPTDGGKIAFTLGGRTEVCGMSYDTTHNSVLLTFPIEYLSDQFTGYDTKDTLVDRIIEFFGGIPDVTTESCCQGITGDLTDPMDGIIDIADLVVLIDYMFRDGPEPLCPEEGDVNGDGGELLDISDLLYLIDYMFTDGPQPAACP